MGFDAIDRQFRPKEIKLECVDCRSTARDVKPREGGNGDEPLCQICYFGRHAWID